MSSLKVILDTNFLLAPFQFGLDIVGEMESAFNRKIDPVVLSPTLHELLKMTSSRSVKMRRLSKSALELAKRFRVIEVEFPQDKTVDDVIIQKAKELNCAVATNDKELIKRLEEEGIPRAFLRGRRKVEVKGVVR